MSKSSKKRPYRAIRLSRVEVNDVLDQVKGQRVVIGVDVAKTKMVLAVMDESGQVVVTVRWSHPVETESLVGFLEELREVAQEVSVAMEPSGVYGDALRWRLLGAGFEVFRVSAKKSHDMAEIYDGVASSHDAKSAAIVAELHASDRSTPWPQESKRHRELSAALRLVEVFGKQARQNTNRLEALSARHWPELTSILDLGTATLLELLMSFGGPQSVAQDREEAGDLMRRVGGSKLAPEKVEAVLASAPVSLGLPMTPEEERLVRTLASETRRNRLELRKALRRVEALVPKERTTKRLSVVVGKTTAAVLFAGVGDPRSFESPRCLVKAVGLNLRERSSGEKQNRGLHITKRGTGVARMYLWMAALRAIQWDPVIRAWYLKKVQRQGGQAKTKAVVAVMRKLTLALWHVAQGQDFDSAKLFDTRRLSLDSQ